PLIVRAKLSALTRYQRFAKTRLEHLWVERCLPVKGLAGVLPVLRFPVWGLAQGGSLCVVIRCAHRLRPGRRGRYGAQPQDQWCLTGKCGRGRLVLRASRDVFAILVALLAHLVTAVVL